MRKIAIERDENVLINDFNDDNFEMMNICEKFLMHDK